MKDKPPKINEEEFKAWLENPVTQNFFSWCYSSREELKESWASGGYKDSSGFVSAQANADAMARCDVLGRIVSITYEEVTEKDSGN